MSQEITPKKKTKAFSVLSIIATVFSTLYFLFLMFFGVTVLIDVINYVPDSSTLDGASLGVAFFIIFSLYELIPTVIAIIFSIINLFFRKKTGKTTLLLNISYIVVLLVLSLTLLTMINQN